jgi:ParB family chromosome partitioning protein
VVNQHVEALKARGLTSPYLKAAVVARINPLRFRPKDAPALSYDEAMDRITKAAAKFNPAKLTSEDLARTGGTPEGTE